MNRRDFLLGVLIGGVVSCPLWSFGKGILNFFRRPPAPTNLSIKEQSSELLTSPYETIMPADWEYVRIERQDGLFTCHIDRKSIPIEDIWNDQKDFHLANIHRRYLV